jgi:hypothetical protein
MHALLPASWVPLGFLFCPDGDLTVALGGPTAWYLEAGGVTAGPSGPTTPPPPPGPNAPSGLTAASCGQTAHRKEVDGTTATQGGQTAQPFAAPSSHASLTSAVPHAVPTTYVVPHAAPTPPPAPHVAPMSTTSPAPPTAPVFLHGGHQHRLYISSGRQ